jgi:ABC-type polysaccharide/polyol phosphate transport system ATPase subunit
VRSYIDLDDVHLSFKKLNSHDFSIRRLVVEKTVSLLTGKKMKPEEAPNPDQETLKGITMHLEHGTKLGLAGRNGAGKSTLLRVMAGIYAPTSGTVKVQGRVTTLLTSGMCIDNNLTGLENIALGCSLLGIPSHLVKEKTEEIIDFSELEKSIHKPVGHYSDGMRARLGFAVATSVEPEILLIDEVIGAGDKFFIDKAMARINKLIEASSLLVLASHDESIMRRICNKVALIEEGKVVSFGAAAEVLDNYKVAA